jgi:hypothetical protein
MLAKFPQSGISALIGGAGNPARSRLSGGFLPVASSEEPAAQLCFFVRQAILPAGGLSGRRFRCAEKYSGFCTCAPTTDEAE